MEILKHLILSFLLSMSTCKNLNRRKQDFVFLGAFTPTTNRGRSIIRADDKRTNYYLSTNPTTWNEAKNDCESIFGDAGSLASIETEDENKKIKRLMEDHGDIGTFWIGGWFDTQSNSFRWLFGDQPNVTTGKGWSQDPWAKDLPRTRSTVSRMYLTPKTRERNEWSYSADTLNRRYMCEVAQSPGTCIRNTDIIFGLDASYSMKDILEAAGHFIYNLTEAFVPFERNGFGFFLYDDFEVNWIYPLPEGLSLDEIGERLSGLQGKYRRTSQNHIMAIETATKELLENSSPGIPGNIVIITDGEVKEDENNLAASVKKLVKKAVNIFVVGVASQKVQEKPEIADLVSIAGGKREKVFKADDVSLLHTIFNQTLQAICDS